MGAGIPFAVTEYAEQSAEDQRNTLPMMAMYAADMPGCPPENRAKILESLKKERPIELNPFARPGQREIGAVRMPNLVNGFTFRVA